MRRFTPRALLLLSYHRVFSTCCSPYAAACHLAGWMLLLSVSKNPKIELLFNIFIGIFPIKMMKSLVFLGVAAPALAAKVKIMSFNIDCRVCDLHHENGDSWRERTQNELDTMARHDPDLIGIQEPILRLDVMQLVPKGYKALYFNDSKYLPWGVYPDAVMMYKEDRFTVKNFNYFWLGPNPYFPAGFDRLNLPRLAVYSQFEDKTDGTNFYFGSTHFDHGDDMEGKNVACTESAKELLRFTAPIADNFPFLWVGDFNSKTANNNAYSILTNVTADFHLEDSYYNSPTQTVTTNQDPVQAYDYNDSIDHIFYANNHKVATYTPVDWTVDMYMYGTKSDPNALHYASDHYAIISTIDVKAL